MERFDLTLEFDLVDTQAEIFKKIVEIQDTQKRARVDHASKIMKSHQAPFANADFEQLSRFFPDELEEILRHHRGYEIWQKFRSLVRADKIFDQSIHDFRKAIQNYFDLEGSNRFDEISEHQKIEIDRSVQKELIALLNANATVAQLSMDLKKIDPEENYQESLNKYFGNDEIIEFIKLLRNSGQH